MRDHASLSRMYMLQSRLDHSLQIYDCVLFLCLPSAQLCPLSLQRPEPGEELQIGLSQQKPLTLSPPSRRYQRPVFNHGSTASLASYEHGEGMSPPLHQSDSPRRVTRQNARSASAQHSGLAHSPSAGGGEEEEAQGQEMTGNDAHEGSGAQTTQNATGVEIQRGYGSRLALSLGDLDIPQLLAERDLHQGELVGMSPSNTSEPLAGDHFGGVLGNSLMLNNLRCSGNLPAPKPFQAGDPGMVPMMHNLAHWPEKARQEQEQLLHQAQHHSGHDVSHLSSPFHQHALKPQSCSPNISPQGGADPSAALSIPPGSYGIPGRGPSITSGAKLDCALFSGGGRSAMAGNYSSCPDHRLTG